MITARAKEINATDGPDVFDAYKLILEMVGQKELLPIVANVMDDGSFDSNDNSNTVDGNENQEKDGHTQCWVNTVYNGEAARVKAVDQMSLDLINDIVRKHKYSKPTAAIGTLRKKLKDWANAKLV